MKATVHSINRTPVQSLARSILYIGSAANEFCEYFYKHIGDVEFVYKELVYDAFLVARERNFDSVIVDQRGDKLATKLVLPVLSTLTRAPEIIVVCAPQDVHQYLGIPGVMRVIASPVNPAQLMAALKLRKADARAETPKSPAPPANADAAARPAPQNASTSGTKTASTSVLDRISSLNIGFLTTVVSALYKRAAFILLASLFTAFCFYGMLIVFFLLSSSWAAPITLEKGHELVLKAEAQLAQLKVDLNTTEQRIAEVRLESDSAARNKESAQLMMDYTGQTIAKDLRSLERGQKTGAAELKRLADLLALFRSQLGDNGMRADLNRLYKARLIDKKSFNSGALGLLDATQKLRQLEGQYDAAKDKMENTKAAIAMLNSLQKRLSGNTTGDIIASSQEYLQLARQAFDARGSYDAAIAELEITSKKLRVLESSRSVIELHTSELEAAPAGRAITGRVDVLFVPYGSEGSFQEGQTLYSCAFTILWCSEAGKVGVRVPGESAGIHPFFGKPIRGVFVEVNLSDPHAATREIMHAGRPPLLF